MRILMAALLGAGLMSGTTSAAETPLDALQWKKRVFLVFAEPDGADAKAQRAAIDGAEAEDRDLLVLAVPASGPVAVDGLGERDAGALRRAYAVDGGAPFTVLLVGKDGGVKRRASQPIAGDELFALIDAMPMRANETRRRN